MNTEKGLYEVRIACAEKACELIPQLMGNTKQVSAIVAMFKECVEKFPQQRIGQIFCNYICPDYRMDGISKKSLKVMKALFDIEFDPFFEESLVTVRRWEDMIRK